MAMSHSFWFSREFKQLCVLAMAILAAAVGVVIVSMLSNLRHVPSKSSATGQKRGGKWHLKGR